MANPADTTYSFISETVAGTTPATPAFKYFDYIPGSDLTYSGKALTSDVLKQNRAAAGTRKVAYSCGGSLKTQFRRDTTTDIILSSLLSGAFATNVLKGGNTDSTMTIEKYMKDATSMYFRYTGMQCSKMALSVAADGNAEATFDFVGLNRTTASAIITGATYTAATQGALYDGTDLGTITIGSLTASFTQFDLSIEQNREAQFMLGSTAAVQVGTTSPRAIKATVTMYRKDLQAEGLFLTDTPISASFTFGSGTNNQYIITLPAVVGSIPADSVSGTSALVAVDLMAQFDPTSGTDISITKA